MKKYLNIWSLLAIVVYSVVVVLLRHSSMDIPNWVMWVLAFVLIAVVEFASSKKSGTEE